MNTYNIVFRGKSAEGFSTDQVKATLGGLLKITDPAGLDSLFSGRAVVLKRAVTRDVADTLCRKLAGKGVICDIEPAGSGNSSAITVKPVSNTVTAADFAIVPVEADAEIKDATNWQRSPYP